MEQHIDQDVHRFGLVESRRDSGNKIEVQVFGLGFRV
jgi:hypothetical protein